MEKRDVKAPRTPSIPVFVLPSLMLFAQWVLLVTPIFRLSGEFHLYSEHEHLSEAQELKSEIEKRWCLKVGILLDTLRFSEILKYFVWNMFEMCCSNGRFFLGKGLVTAIDAVHGVVTHVSVACVTCAKSWSSRPCWSKKMVLQKSTTFWPEGINRWAATKRLVSCRTQNTLVNRLWHLTVGWHTFWPGATFDDVEVAIHSCEYTMFRFSIFYGEPLVHNLKPRRTTWLNCPIAVKTSFQTFCLDSK